MRAADLGGAPGHGEQDGEKGGSDGPSSDEDESGVSITQASCTTVSGPLDPRLPPRWFDPAPAFGSEVWP